MEKKSIIIQMTALFAILFVRAAYSAPLEQVNTSSSQTLTNKTLTSPTVTSPTITGTTTVGAGSTITSPVIDGSPTISGSLVGSSPLVLEGTTADDFETTIAVQDPTADRTHTIPNTTSDTFGMLNATQTFTNKTLDDPVLTKDAEASLPASATEGKVIWLDDGPQGLVGDFGSKLAHLFGYNWIADSYTDCNAAITAIGATQATLVVQKNCVISATVAAPTTLTWRFEGQGQISPATTKVLTINGPVVEPPLRKVFNCVGTEACILGLSKTNPVWFGALGDGSTADNNAFASSVSALVAGGEIEITTPATYYRLTSAWTINKSAHIYGKLPDIRQVTTDTNAIKVTSSDVSIEGLMIAGPQFAAQVDNEVGIFATGTAGNPPTYISNIEIKGNKISNFGIYGVLAKYIQHYDISHNNVFNVRHAGIATLSTKNGVINGNRVRNITGTLAENAYGIFLSRITTTDTTQDPHSQNITVCGNEILDVVNWEGIDTHSGRNIVICGNVIRNTNMGIAVGPSVDSLGVASYAPLNISVVGNSIDSTVTDGSRREGIIFVGAITTAGTPTQKATGIIVGNSIKRHGAASNSLSGALHVHTTQGLTVSGNNIIEASPTAYNFLNDNYDFTFTGNTAIDPWANSGNASGVALRSGYNTGIITGNVFAKDAKSASVVLNIAINIATSTSTAADIGLNRSEAALYVNGVGSVQNSGTATLSTGSVVVTLAEAEANSNYSVFLSGDRNETFWVGGETTTQFTINSSNSSSVAKVKWWIVRR